MVEGARLESVFTGNRNEGSNPSLSASSPLQFSVLLTLLMFLTTLALADTPRTMTEAEALKIAGKHGTWTQVERKGRHFYVSSSSKSLKPPTLTIIDATSGKILLFLDNTGDPKQQTQLRALEATF